MDLKQCPFWVIAGILPDYTQSTLPFQSQSFNDAVTKDFNVFNCKGEKCQMWNSETKDCGLKQATVPPVLEEIKATVVEMSRNLKEIRYNIG